MLMLTQEQTPHVRPYWHVDVKWIAGIVAFLVLSICLLLYNLAVLTQRDNAVTISATVVASLFSPKGLDDTSGLKDFREQVVKMPGDMVAPIQQFPSIKISKHDALTLSAADLKIALFSQVTGPIYDLGLPAAARQFTANTADQQKFINQAQLLGLLTKGTHDTVQHLFILALVVSAVFMIIVIFFSTGWGRLVSPGIILLLLSPIGSLAALILLNPPDRSDSLTAAIPGHIGQAVGTSLSHSYIGAMLLGLILIVAALIGKIITVILHHSKT